ncbi:hypothetical protein M0802_006850 [Mischocyttarus mexicanus]|nr:hypothetical protein M0802_006850 [Mischocyttarus mexicanus]
MTVKLKQRTSCLDRTIENIDIRVLTSVVHEPLPPTHHPPTTHHSPPITHKPASSLFVGSFVQKSLFLTKHLRVFNIQHIHIHIHMYLPYIDICIYTEREREREKLNESHRESIRIESWESSSYEFPMNFL